jgi:hypothetical protein
VVRRLLPRKLMEIGEGEPLGLNDHAAESLAALAAAVQGSDPYFPQNSSTRTVMSSDCGAPSVNVETAP